MDRVTDVGTVVRGDEERWQNLKSIADVVMSVVGECHSTLVNNNSNLAELRSAEFSLAAAVEILEGISIEKWLASALDKHPWLVFDLFCELVRILRVMAKSGSKSGMMVLFSFFLIKLVFGV